MGTKHAKKGGILCSEILDLHFRSPEGREREVKANLEEIWSTGAIVLADERIPPLKSLWFMGGNSEFRGQVVAQTLNKGLGYFIEMRFQQGCEWSERQYCPKHFFNPMVALANRIFEATLHAPSGAAGSLCTFATTAAGGSLKHAPGQAF